MLDDTLEVIKRLAEAGAMVSLKKSTICDTKGKVLGHEWHSGGLFTPQTKGLLALLEFPDERFGELERASIYGLLNYFRPYVQDFAVRTEPVRQLLSKTSAGWTTEHTRLVKDTIEKILKGLPVMNFEPEEEVRLELNLGPLGYAGVML